MKSLILFSTISSLILFGAFKSLHPIKKENSTSQKDYPTSLVSLNDFQKLAAEVEQHRAERLINLDTFIDLSKKENTIILDTRSKVRFDRKHLAGAIHLAFTEFSQANLEKLIPDPNTQILIYCNNNFEGDQIDFMSKVAAPQKTAMKSLDKKPVMLALNIPTYLNLYGYGYTNVYELHELVNVNDLRIKFEGSAIKDFPKVNAMQKLKR